MWFKQGLIRQHLIFGLMKNNLPNAGKPAHPLKQSQK